jgi:hypothetical protein
MNTDVRRSRNYPRYPRNLGLNGSEDWPQRGAEGTKAEAGGLTANRRSSTLISNRGVPTENTEDGIGFFTTDVTDITDERGLEKYPRYPRNLW